MKSLINLIIALLFALVGYLLYKYADQWNNPLFDIGYLVSVPFCYFLTVALYPKVTKQNLSLHIVGIVLAIIIYITIQTQFNMDRIIQVATTTLISAFFTYFITSLVYDRRKPTA